jgi:hypothetical protein
MRCLPCICRFGRCHLAKCECLDRDWEIKMLDMEVAWAFCPDARVCQQQQPTAASSWLQHLIVRKHYILLLRSAVMRMLSYIGKQVESVPWRPAVIVAVQKSCLSHTLCCTAERGM